MADSVDKEAANQAVVAIEARLDMADLGGQIAADAAAASGAAGAAKEAWDLLLKADALAREAALMVVETTDENVTASLDKTNQALELFRQADDRFAQAADRYPAADFSPYRTYLAKRIEAMGYAVAADEAFLAKNKEETIAQNDAYNRLTPKRPLWPPICPTIRCAWWPTCLMPPTPTRATPMQRRVHRPHLPMLFFVIIWERPANSVYFKTSMPCKISTRR